MGNILGKKTNTKKEEAPTDPGLSVTQAPVEQAPVPTGLPVVQEEAEVRLCSYWPFLISNS